MYTGTFVVCHWQKMEHVQYMPKEAKREQEQQRLLKTILFGYNCLIFVSRLREYF